MYHQVCAEGTFVPSDFIVGKNVLRRQLQYLAKNGFYTPSVDELLKRNLSRAGKKPVLITFDDGYVNNYEHALPVLKEVGFRATISMVADPKLRSNVWDQKKGIAPADLMEPGQMREMHAEGIEFASHSYSHPSMPSLSDKELEKELLQSKQRLEDIFQHNIRCFTYPYGDVDERVKRAVEITGYACAFATHSGPLDFYSDLFEIRRLLIKNRDDEPYLFSKFSGLDRTITWGKWYAKKLFGKHNKFQFELDDNSPSSGENARDH